MFYRRKLLLALLDALGGSVQAIDFQKYLFLLTRRQQEPAFNFVPHRFGCYSFQSEADKRALADARLIGDEKGWRLLSRDDFKQELRVADQEAVDAVKGLARKLKGKDLVRHVYVEFPDYAVRSEIAKDILSAQELREIESRKATPIAKCLFTIGYEGRDVDQYLKQLLDAGVRLLCDVRRNPLSRKYGFSKSALSGALSSVGIEYRHIPELGIESDLRKNLKTFADYQRLFARYEHETLKQQELFVRHIAAYVAEFSRVALTCFERDPKFCHRGRVAQAIEKLPDWKWQVSHL